MILSNLQPFVQGWNTSKRFIGWLATTPDRKARTFRGESGGFLQNQRANPTQIRRNGTSRFSSWKKSQGISNLCTKKWWWWSGWLSGIEILELIGVLSTPYWNISRSSESVHSPYPNLKPSEKNWFIRDIGLKDGPFRRVKCYKPIQVYRFLKQLSKEKNLVVWTIMWGLS